MKVGDKIHSNEWGWTLTITKYNIGDPDITYDIDTSSERDQTVSVADINDMIKLGKWALIPQSIPINTSSGMNCKKCNLFNEYADPNISDYICCGCQIFSHIFR